MSGYFLVFALLALEIVKMALAILITLGVAAIAIWIVAKLVGGWRSGC